MEQSLTPFYKAGFSFPFFFVHLLNVAATSVVHRSVDPPANELCPGCRAMQSVSVQSCPQPSMTQQITHSPV